jgi:hypothetical protein
VNGSHNLPLKQHAIAIMKVAQPLSYFALLPLALTQVTAQYGADCSFPILNEELVECPLGRESQQAKYDHFMEGCRKFYGAKGNRCDTTEKERVEMSARQAQSMVVSRLSSLILTKAERQFWSNDDSHSAELHQHRLQED